MSFAIPSPYAWDASFCVGEPTMNEQHKQLFVLIDNLDKARTAANFQSLVDLVCYLLCISFRSPGLMAKRS